MIFFFFSFDVLINRFFKNLLLPAYFCFVVERIFYVCSHKMITSELLSFSWSKARHNFMYYFKQKLIFLWPMWCSKLKVFDFLQWLSMKKIHVKKKHSGLKCGMKIIYSESQKVFSHLSSELHDNCVWRSQNFFLEFFLISAFLIHWTRWVQIGSNKLSTVGRTNFHFAKLLSR